MGFAPNARSEEFGCFGRHPLGSVARGGLEVDKAPAVVFHNNKSAITYGIRRPRCFKQQCFEREMKVFFNCPQLF